MKVLSLDELDREVKRILSQYETIAIVGLSRNPSKDSHTVANYLKTEGYEIIPVNPFCEEVMGRKCYKSLQDIPDEIAGRIEIVDIFRPASAVPPIVGQAIDLRKKHAKPEVIWMQLGIVNEEAAKIAENVGMTVVMNRCIKIEHSRIKRNEELSG